MEQAPNLYDQLVGGFWKHRQGLEDMRQKNLNFEQDYARDEMKIPEEVAKSQLATMTAQADQELLPMQTATKKQVLDDEFQFNVLKDMRSLIDDADIPEQEKDEMFQRGILKLSGVSGQPTLADTQKVARARYLIQGMKQNPQGAKAKIDEYMSTLARNFKSTQAQDLARTRGDIQHTNTLLKAESDAALARIRASSGAQWAKNWEQYTTIEMQKALADNNMPRAQYFAEQSKEARLARAIQSGEAQGTRNTANVNPEGTVEVKKVPASVPQKPVISNASKTPAVTGTSSTVSVTKRFNPSTGKFEEVK